jgi:integrase
MTVYLSKDQFRKKKWCSDLFVGSQRVKKYFATEKLAKAHDAREATSINDTGKLTKNKNISKYIIKRLVEEYRDEVMKNNRGAKFEASRIKTFLTHPSYEQFIKKPLSIANKYHARACFKDRENYVSKQSVARERNIWVQIFEHAMTKEEYDGLTNICSGIKLKASKKRRNRRLNEYEHELERLERACDLCHGHNQFYVKLAIRIAIHTGMRQGEIFNLRWSDIWIHRREINITEDKTGHMERKKTKGRTIAMSPSVEFLLCRLAYNLIGNNKFNRTNKILPMTQYAFSRAWLRTVARASIPDLHFHDLRHEAASRFDEADLSTPQRLHMTGHTPLSQGDAYVHSQNRKILEKLDRYHHKHLTDAEWQKLLQEEHMQTVWQEREGTTIEQWAVWYEEAFQEDQTNKQEHNAKLAYLNSIVNRNKDVELVEVPKYHRIQVVPDNVLKLRTKGGK